MKFRKNKKGFTIVELIIVIAVIGVLTAVMVPTIVHLVNKANKASDDALISNLNKALAMREAETAEKPSTMHEAVEGLEEYGFKLDALVAKSDQALLYNLGANKFVLANDESVSGHQKEFWRIQDNIDDQTYNIYASSKFSGEVVDLTVGFDAGYKMNIESVEYERIPVDSNDKQTVVIRTNGGTLTVNAPNDVVKHYNNLDTLNVTAVDKNSYHENGAVVNVANITFGRVVVEEGGYIRKVDTTSVLSSADASLEVDGYVKEVVPSEDQDKRVVADPQKSSGYVASNDGEVVGTIETANAKIYSIADLHAFRDRVNVGAWQPELTASLEANIDLTGVVWEPIGNKNAPFAGTFDGKGHIIKGLTNAGYSIKSEDIFTTSTSLATGAPYGLFGVIGSLESYNEINGEDADVTLKNVKFEQVDIDLVNDSNMSAALVAADISAAKVYGDYSGDITISNVEVLSGSIKAKDSVAGVAGKLYTYGKVTVTGCKNSASISNNDAGNFKVSGIMAYRNHGTAEVTNCTNTADIKKYGTGFASSIANLGYKPASPKTIEDYLTQSGNTNTGSVAQYATAESEPNLTVKNHLFNYAEAGKYIG